MYAHMYLQYDLRSLFFRVDLPTFLKFLIEEHLCLGISMCPPGPLGTHFGVL